jgi:multidrug efflux system membrane fusion protein
MVLAVCLLALSGCSLDKSKQNGPQPPQNPPVFVTVAPVVETTVPLQIRTIGLVEPYSTVLVKAQIEGTLMRVHFKEGQDVKTSDVLFTIDPRPYVAALDQAQANLARDRIHAENARREASRSAALHTRGIASDEERDKSAAEAAAYEADVRADIAAVETAKVKLDYCTIRSPIDGRTGSLKVHEGNLVKGNDVLVTIVQLSPAYVDFSVPEQDLPDLKKYMAAGKLKVEASASDDMSNPAVGELTFVDNMVDDTLGTILLKGTFPNSDRTLWPGQFVNVVLTLTYQPDVVVVESRAVQTGQNSQYVFVLTPKSTVEERTVVVGRTLENEHKTILTKGVKAGEKVVTDGLLRLVGGATVKVQDAIATKTLDSQQPSEKSAEKK